MSYFFCGIGGSGMSALAQLLVHRGECVKGSDRGFDRGQSSELQAKLTKQGILLCPQDGSGVTVEDIMIVSTAIEDSIPDIQCSKALGIPIIHRATLLSQFFNNAHGIAVAGTSGKSSTTALVGHVIAELGLAPTIVNGAIMPEFRDEMMVGNALIGSSDFMVVEADESDGSLVNYQAEIGVITNVSKDHKTLPELYELFSTFASHCKRLIINLDCEKIKNLSIPSGCEVFTFSTFNPAADLVAEKVFKTPQGIEFSINQSIVKLPLMGLHNVENALVAISVALLLGKHSEEIAATFPSFQGINRRMQLIGVKNGVTVIDDFAHNPDKIRAVLQAVKGENGRSVVVFQPHGFRPVKFLKDEFIESFFENTTAEDLIIMPEIYYAGGSADRSISSKVLIDALVEKGRSALFIPERSDIPAVLKKETSAGDKILLLGARDATLSQFAQDVFQQI